MLRRPGRFAEFMKTGQTTPADAHARLAEVRCPALVIMGSADPDFADPEAEAKAIVAAAPDGVGRVVMIENGGHYPHAQSADDVAAAIIPFLAGARRGTRAPRSGAPCDVRALVRPCRMRGGVPPRLAVDRGGRSARLR